MNKECRTLVGLAPSFVLRSAHLEISTGQSHKSTPRLVVSVFGVALRFDGFLAAARES